MADSPDVQTLVAQAQQLLRAGQYQPALAAYELARNADPDQPDVYEGMGLACFMLGQYPEAIGHFKQVTLLDPRRAAPYVNMGAVFNKMGEYQQAIEPLRKAVQLDKRSGEGYYNLGFAYRHLKQHALAIPAYREAIRLDPGMAEAYQNLGNVYFDMANYAQSIAQFKKALELRPTFERAQRGLAKAQNALSAAKAAINPLGRLVEESAPIEAHTGAAHRELSEEERQRDRNALKKLGQELEAGGEELLHLLRGELEPTVKQLVRFLTQKEAPLGGRADTFKAFRDLRLKYIPVRSRLNAVVKKLRDHEATVE